MKFSLQHALLSLTRALDFVGVDEVNHGKRVALIASDIARECGWSKADCHDALFAGMLHDCGVSRTQEHRHLTETLEWAGSQAHCLRGEAYLLDCPPLLRFAPAVRWHHTRWEVLARGIPGLAARDALMANLIFLADRTDVLLAPYIAANVIRSEILLEYPRIVDKLASLSGLLFHPELVAGLQRVARRESFWLQADPAYVSEEILDRFSEDDLDELPRHGVLALARLFARTVDAKSIYTLEHSTRVAALSRFLAEQGGWQGEVLDEIEVAGLLHDIGKLRVAEEIVDKPGAISDAERAVMKRHSYDTARILRMAFPGLPLAEWGGMHHENLLGTGYPSHRQANEIAREARLIAVADIFQALSQDRPYRARLEAAKVMAHLDALAAEGQLDATLVGLVRSHLPACYAIATGAQ